MWGWIAGLALRHVFRKSEESPTRNYVDARIVRLAYIRQRGWPKVLKRNRLTLQEVESLGHQFRQYRI
jgi:hypothetical protein